MLMTMMKNLQLEQFPVHAVHAVHAHQLEQSPMVMKNPKLEQSPLFFALDDDEESAQLDLSDLEERYRQEIGARGLNEEFFLTTQKDGIVFRLYPTGDFTDMKFTNSLLDSVAATVDRLQRQRAGGPLRLPGLPPGQVAAVGCEPVAVPLTLGLLSR